MGCTSLWDDRVLTPFSPDPQRNGKGGAGGRRRPPPRHLARSHRAAGARSASAGRSPGGLLDLALHLAVLAHERLVHDVPEAILPLDLEAGAPGGREDLVEDRAPM